MCLTGDIYYFLQYLKSRTYGNNLSEMKLPAILHGYCSPFFISNSKMIFKLKSVCCHHDIYGSKLQFSFSFCSNFHIKAFPGMKKLRSWGNTPVVTRSLVKHPMPLLSLSQDREWTVKGKYFYKKIPPDSEITFT